MVKNNVLECIKCSQGFDPLTFKQRLTESIILKGFESKSEITLSWATVQK